MWTKTQGPELEAETDFKGWCSNLDRYIFDIGLRNSYKLARTMKDMERYLGAIYIDRFQTAIMAEKLGTLPEPDMSTVILDTGFRHLKTDKETTYLENNKIDKTIHQNQVREIYMKLTCTEYIILLWVRKMSNYRIRRHRTPSYRQSRQASTILDT